MLAEPDMPKVVSVSYGWQGDLAQVGCKASHWQAVDADFAKLAARGVSVIFASGDSGSGYKQPMETQCGLAHLAAGEALQGEVTNTLTMRQPELCCAAAAEAVGFTFIRDKASALGATVDPQCPSGESPGQFEKSRAACECESSEPPPQFRSAGHG